MKDIDAFGVSLLSWARMPLFPKKNTDDTNKKMRDVLHFGGGIIRQKAYQEL